GPTPSPGNLRPHKLLSLSETQGLKESRVDGYRGRGPAASILLRYRDDGGRSAAGPDRDRPVPAARGRPLRGRAFPGDRGVGVGREAGDPDGPRQGGARANLGLRAGREPAPLRLDLPDRTGDEVEPGRMGPCEAEVLLVHEALRGPGADPRDAEPRFSCGIELAQFLGEGEGVPNPADVPRRSICRDHRVRDEGEERGARSAPRRTGRPRDDGRPATPDAKCPRSGENRGIDRKSVV